MVRALYLFAHVPQATKDAHVQSKTASDVRVTDRTGEVGPTSHRQPTVSHSVVLWSLLPRLLDKMGGCVMAVVL